jgi:hypothetical protein
MFVGCEAVTSWVGSGCPEKAMGTMVVIQDVLPSAQGLCAYITHSTRIGPPFSNAAGT